MKIGKFYITRNNPRELLLEIKELKDKISELEHPAEQLLRINGFLNYFDKLVEEHATYKAKLNMVKDLIINSDFGNCTFKNDILAILGDDEDDKIL